MNKKNYSDEIKMILRGYKLLWKTGGDRYISYKILSNMFKMAYPFVNIFFSAKIVNELAYGKDFNTLLILAVMTICVNLIFQASEKVFLRRGEAWFRSFRDKYSMLIPEKLMEMDYENIENLEVQSLRGRLREMENYSNRGLMYLFSSIDRMIQPLFQIIMAVGMSATLFTFKTTSESEIAKALDSPLMSTAIFIVILAAGIMSSKIAEHSLARFENTKESALFLNRIFNFYGGKIMDDPKTGKDIRLFNMAGKMIDDFKNAFAQSDVSIMRTFRTNAYISTVKSTIGILISFLAYLFVVLKAYYGAFGVGNVVQYVGAITQLGIGMVAFISSYGMLIGNNAYLKLCFDYLDIPNRKNEGNMEIGKNKAENYEIEFKNVSFKYPDTEKYVLKNVNLKFKIGERMAVVGVNGSGKTTMIKLLCRLYDPTEGEIRLNGIDIRNYDYKEYLSIFSVVFQDFKLFSFELGQNVAASIEYDEEKINEVLLEAGFAEKLSRMKNGLDSFLYKEYDAEGEDISGGEAQKIAIARALYRNAPFIILDEPTAALDPIAEAEIYSKFNEIVNDRTAIYISHRLSSCRFCDRIIVFDEGQIVQEGNHNILVAEEMGKYQELWNAQAQYYQ